MAERPLLAAVDGDGGEGGEDGDAGGLRRLWWGQWIDIRRRVSMGQGFWKEVLWVDGSPPPVGHI